MTYVSPSIAANLVSSLPSKTLDKDDTTGCLGELTAREEPILEFVAQGLSPRTFRSTNYFLGDMLSDAEPTRSVNAHDEPQSLSGYEYRPGHNECSGEFFKEGHLEHRSAIWSVS